MAKFTRRNFIKASGATGIVAGVVAPPALVSPFLAFEAAEKPILTVEGLGDGTNLDPIQEIGIRNMAGDCGYCTAGWLTVAKTFLQKNPNPTEDEIKDVLARHLCGCSAYVGIIKTVKDTASYMRGEATL